MTASIDESAAHLPSRTARTGRRHHDAEVTDLDKVRADRLTAAQQRRAAARSRDLTALLRDRPDLAGVHAPADFAAESVRWSV